MKKILLLVLCIFTLGAYAQHTSTGNSTDWDSSTAWDQGSVPTSSDDVVINHEIIVTDSDQVCDDLTVNYNGGSGSLTVSGASAKLDAGGTGTISGAVTITGGTAANPATLDIAGALTLSGSITINAGQRFILGSSGSTANTTATGPIHINSASDSHGSFYNYGTWTSNGINGVLNYNRFIANLDTWDLIGVPVSNLSISTFATTENDLASGGGSGNDQYAIGTYTNTTAAYPGSTWLNYTTSTVAAAGNFEPGKGYQMASSGEASGEGKEVTFSGNPNTGTVTEAVVNSENGASGENDQSDGTKFNLISNPYPSFLSTTTFINVNTSILHSGIHQAVYGWDGSSYDTYNLAAAGFIAPAQGFMVGAQSSSSANISFTTVMQSTSNTSMDDFIENNPMDPDDRAELFVGISQDGLMGRTRFYFLDNTTDGLDIGYDAGVIDLANSMIYSRLLQDDEGYSIDIQSLAYSEMWDKVIPIGINATAGEEITVSVTHKTTPADLKIYLEDAQEGTFTLINNEDFVLTPTSDLNGVGRFFIHMTANALSDGEVNTSLLNAYKKVDSNYITIEGLATRATSTEVSLFNILGTKVMDTTLDNTTNTQMISTNGLSTGIYVLKLESGKNQLTKKLIIK